MKHERILIEEKDYYLGDNSQEAPENSLLLMKFRAGEYLARISTVRNLRLQRSSFLQEAYKVVKKIDINKVKVERITDKSELSDLETWISMS